MSQPLVDNTNINLSAYEKNIFYKQLKLINTHERKLILAAKDYFKAFEQRSNWVRTELLYIDELDKYETRLVDEWEHCYADMLDVMSYEGDQSNDNQIKHGKLLLKEIEKKDIRIRARCADPFIMRGSYHILADQLKVGWHADFESILKK